MPREAMESVGRRIGANSNNTHASGMRRHKRVAIVEVADAGISFLRRHVTIKLPRHQIV